MRAINLLPPEAFEKAKARRRIFMWILMGLAYVAVLAVLTFWWQSRVGTAEDAFAEQEAANIQLQTQVAALSDAQLLADTYAENVVLLAGALGVDVSWGRLLNDLARMLPERVWLESFDGAVAQDGSIGALQIAGIGFGFPDVAAWLRSLDSDRFPGVTGTWVTGTSRTQIGAADVVTFSSSTSLTEAALSNRIDERIPVVAP
jgi:Tfp pilus assembly protein PilN